MFPGPLARGVCTHVIGFAHAPSSLHISFLCYTTNEEPLGQFSCILIKALVDYVILLVDTVILVQSRSLRSYSKYLTIQTRCRIKQHNLNSNVSTQLHLSRCLFWKKKLGFKRFTAPKTVCFLVPKMVERADTAKRFHWRVRFMSFGGPSLILTSLVQRPGLKPLTRAWLLASVFSFVQTHRYVGFLLTTWTCASPK